MSVYFEPLQTYFRASSARSIGEAPDVVAGFFADRLRRQEYLASWDPDQRPLRQFLINGFWLYLREKLGRRKRRGRIAELSDHFPDLAEASHESPERQFDRAWVRQVVRRAMDDASEVCAERGLEDHWKIFRRHLFEHEPYTALAEEYGIAPERAAVMCRTATRRFVESLHQLLARDGSRAASQQVQELLEIIQ